jgi:hypothetical protein
MPSRGDTRKQPRNWRASNSSPPTQTHVPRADPWLRQKTITPYVTALVHEHTLLFSTSVKFLSVHNSYMDI